jgi:hypothetical protein
MCFSESQSYINAILLIGGGIYLLPKYRLSIVLIFLAIKDLIQGLSYRFQNNQYILTLLAKLSWIHISFQPLIINVIASYFSKDNNLFWNFIFGLCIIYGIVLVFTLKDFDLLNINHCKKRYDFDDFCSQITSSYIGKYHLGYQFSRVDDVVILRIYVVLMFIPALFTKSKRFILLWLLFVMFIYMGFPNVGSGEQAAIWCYASILYILPVALLNNQVAKIMV